MRISTVAARGADTIGAQQLDREEVLTVLNNQRRRYVLHYLKWHGREMELRELARQVAAWENEVEISQLSNAERKRVQNALHQFHLPKMDEQGFVDYDASRGRVKLSEQGAKIDFYLDVFPSWNIPWGHYYLLLSALSFVIIIGSLLGAPLLSMYPPLTWALFLAVALSVSSVVHFYVNYYRTRLGAQERPSEVGK